MPTLFPTSQGGEMSSPPEDSVPAGGGGGVGGNYDSNGGGGGDDEIDSVRELNRLLESALRMGDQYDGGGGGGGAGGTTTTNVDVATISAAAATTSLPFASDGSSNYDHVVESMSSSSSIALPFGNGGNGGGGGNRAHQHHHGVHDTTATMGMGGVGGDRSFSAAEQRAASWRLDTARRLSSLLTSPQNSNPGYLLPVLRRQSRYWTPLLLSWFKSGGGANSGGANGSVGGGLSHASLSESLDMAADNALDLPLTAKQRRARRDRSAASTASQEVQIESLRALFALNEWTKHGSGNGKNGREGGGGGHDDAPASSSASATATGRCSPHAPLSASSQRLLLRHSDAVPMVVSLLSSGDAATREQAAWTLGSLASGGLGGGMLPTPAVPAQANAGGEGGAAEAEGGTSSSTSDGGAAAASGDNDDAPSSSSSKGGGRKDSASARDVVLAAGAFGPLLRCLADHPRDVPLHRVGAWCLSGMVEGRYAASTTGASSSSGGADGGGGGPSARKRPSEEVDVLMLLPTMRRLLYVDDAEVLTFACWTLSHLCDGPSYHIAAVIYSDAGLVGAGSRKMSPANGLVPRLVELLLHPSPKVAKPALRTIGNIVCADCTDQQRDRDRPGGGGSCGPPFPVVDFTEIVLECDAVPCLRRLVGHHNREIQKEACWTLSNIAAGTASQIQAVIDSGAVRPLVDLVNNELTDKEVRSEACWVVLNATSCGNDAQISILIEEGCVSVLGVLLSEPNMVMMALEGIERVLQTEEARDSEDLYHASEEELGQRPTIMKCASLIKTVVKGGGPHGNASSAVSKRALRIWDHHFVSCALCHNNYSRCRLRDSHFCNECKCHVCSKCDCRVYHLSYQEELWKEDEEKDKERGKAKKSKKAKKRQKAKEKQQKLVEKKKAMEQSQQEAQVQQETQQQQQPSPPKAVAPSKGAAALASTTKASAAATCAVIPNKKKPNPSSKAVKTKIDQTGEASARPPPKRGDVKKGNAVEATRKQSPSTSPSRDTVESGDITADSLPDGGRVEGAETTSGGESSNEPIDLVQYLQQTGSIIALAKLLDSLYDGEYEDEASNQDGGKGKKADRGRQQQQQQQQKKKRSGRGSNRRVLTTQ